MAAFAFLALFSVLVQIHAERCFHCINIPDPPNCTTVETCGPDQMCSIRQFVKSDGSVLYSSQCLDSVQCGLLSHVTGRRHLAERDTDVTTCYECCNQDFCNNQGCGTKAVPSDQRGPYCYTCNASLDPTACNHVSICKENEQCIVFVSPELSSSSQIVYKSQCESKAACAVLSQAVSNYRCSPTCCSTDFCNNQCGQSSNHSITTTLPHTTPSVIQTQPAAVPTKGLCKQDHYHDDITGLCIKIDETRQLSYPDAQTACAAIGDQLVTIDTHEKTVFIENTILHHSRFTDVSKRQYYIGAYDKRHNGDFYWPNGQRMFYTNWGGGDEVASNKQPDGGTSIHPQNCVVLYGLDHYRWHDDECSHRSYFICEA